MRAGGVPKPRDATSKAVLIPIGPVSSKNQAHLKDKSSHLPNLWACSRRQMLEPASRQSACGARYRAQSPDVQL